MDRNNQYKNLTLLTTNHKIFYHEADSYIATTKTKINYHYKQIDTVYLESYVEEARRALPSFTNCLFM